jgi:hypothetical protein
MWFEYFLAFYACFWVAWFWWMISIIRADHQRRRLLEGIGRTDPSWSLPDLRAWREVSLGRHILQLALFRDPRHLYPHRLARLLPAPWPRLAWLGHAGSAALIIYVVTSVPAPAAPCRVVTGQSQTRGPDGTPDVTIEGVGDVWITHNGVTRRLPTRASTCDDADSLRRSIDADLEGARALQHYGE